MVVRIERNRETDYSFLLGRGVHGILERPGSLVFEFCVAGPRCLKPPLARPTMRQLRPRVFNSFLVPVRRQLYAGTAAISLTTVDW